MDFDDVAADPNAVDVGDVADVASDLVSQIRFEIVGARPCP